MDFVVVGIVVRMDMEEMLVFRLDVMDMHAAKVGIHIHKVIMK